MTQIMVTLKKVIGIVTVIWARSKNITATNETVTNVASVIVSQNHDRHTVIIQNLGPGNSIYIGASGVTHSTGYRIVPGGERELDKTTAAIYAITQTGSADVRILEM